MFNRQLKSTIEKDLEVMPVVAILGPRQVGKTTLAKQITAQAPDRFVYLDLESPADVAKLQDAELFLPTYESKTVIRPLRKIVGKTNTRYKVSNFGECFTKI